MAGEYGMRGEAAMRLMKGKKGAPPPEEDELGLPPEEGMPPEEGAGDMGGLAALLGGAGAPPGGEEPMPEEMPVDEMGGMPPEPMDLESSLAGVEGALEGLAPEAAEEIRTHLNAIREIAAQAGTQQQAPPEEAPPSPEAPPQPDGGAAAGMGMMEPQA